MTAVSASAPGKVVLCGEYAVLDGAPAVCMAIDRRATVKVTDFDGDWHSVAAPGYSSLEGRFVTDGAQLDWLQGGDEFVIVDAVWHVVANRLAQREGNDCLRIELDTRAFIDRESGEKIGVGSSAALTVALSAALTQSTDVLAEAMQAHHRFQKEAGSGVDIMTSVRGGLIEYRMNARSSSPLRWPAGLAYRVIWTGVAASTRMKLQKLADTRHRASRTELLKAAEIMAPAWRSASGVLRELPRYIEALRQFSIDHDLGIFDAGHDQLVNEAVDAGLVYKPCGAGGGDVGILLGTSDEHLDEFMSSRRASGGRVLNCMLETDGVELERR
ncbi:MAG: hypothetical protein KJO95_12765 [Gammaproteobacteria bacterium]|nr:hypothetical protein [Gammaproteobacteria bacterium]MBU2678476.1 hypothetical protein [Gammaproteobacteria bacterium]NNC57308.1 hypothetical protein [Woeseiaceae bacterium]NNL52211.1 hypothetical protein [Woeseiaceae bacterium]